jgi:hypothetical protein
LAQSFIATGQMPANYTAIGSHKGDAKYTFTGVRDPLVPNSYSRIDIFLEEFFRQDDSYSTSVDSFWDRGSLPGEVALAGTVKVSGDSEFRRKTTFDSSKTPLGRNFNVTGNSSSTLNHRN